MESDAGKQLFSRDLRGKLIAVLSRFDCMVVPTSNNIRCLIVDVARYHFLQKTLGLLFTMHSGVPNPHKGFWQTITVEKFFELYKAINATPSAVLAMFEEPEFDNQAEGKNFSTFIGNCKPDGFVTGSSVILDKQITIEFNNITGLARRPILRLHAGTQLITTLTWSLRRILLKLRL